MKKVITIILAAIMLLSLVACSNSSKDNNSSGASQTEPRQTDVPVTESEKKDDAPATETEKKDDVKAEKTPAEIETAIAKALGDGYLATVDVPEDELFTSAISYLDLTKVKSYVAKQAVVSAVDLDAVVIAECEDGYADEATSKLNESFAQTISYIRQYPFGVAKVEGARIYKVGNTVMLIIAGASYEGEDKEAEAKLALEEYQKIDNALSTLFGTLPENLAVIPKN